MPLRATGMDSASHPRLHESTRKLGGQRDLQEIIGLKTSEFEAGKPKNSGTV